MQIRIYTSQGGLSKIKELRDEMEQAGNDFPPAGLILRNFSITRGPPWLTLGLISEEVVFGSRKSGVGR
jgi:hypothetical protein